MSKQNFLSKINLRQILVEMISVVFAVLLALFLNEWRSNLKQKEELNKARANLKEELLSNRDELKQKIQFHEFQYKQLIELKDSLKTLDQPFSSYDVGVAVLNLKKAAWESITLTDVVNRLQFEELSDYSELYRGYQLIEKLQDSYINGAFSLEFNQSENSEYAYRVTRNHLNQMIVWERELLSELEGRL